MMLQFLVTALFGAAAASTATPTVAPADKWVVDYAKSYCALSRHGTGNEPGIAFRTRPFADEHDMLLYFARSGAQYLSAKGKIFIGSSAGVEHGMAVMEPIAKPYRYLDSQISAQELASAAMAGTMRVTIKDQLDLTIPLPHMQRAIAALRTCEDDLARRWQASVGWAKPPKPKKQFYNMVSPRDYPSVAFYRGQTGRARALLKVDANGAVTNCQIIESSGVPLLDDRTCDIFVKRATFEPALDAHGKPVPSSYIPPGIDYRLIRTEW